MPDAPFEITTTAAYTLAAAAASLIILMIFQCHGSVVASGQTVQNPAVDQKQAELALARALEMDDLSTIKSAITDFGLPAGNSSSVLKKARLRRDALVAETRRLARAQRDAERKAERKAERAAEAAARDATMAADAHKKAETELVALRQAAQEAAAEQARLEARSKVRSRFSITWRLISGQRAFTKAHKDAVARAEAARAAAQRAEEVAAAARAKQAGAKPKPSPTWAAVAQAKPIDGGNMPSVVSPIIAHFEDTARAALGAGAHGVPTFQRAVEGMQLPPSMASELRGALVRLAAERLVGEHEHDGVFLTKVLSPLVGVLHAVFLEPRPRLREALFFPNANAHARLIEMLSRARHTLCVCVFTITDDAVKSALIALHKRGVRVRVISDDEQAGRTGSDVFALAEAGIPTVVAEELMRPTSAHRTSLHRVERHMHHKFCIVDASLILTGSYNFTHAAATRNAENILVTSATDAVEACTPAGLDPPTSGSSHPCFPPCLLTQRSLDRHWAPQTPPSSNVCGPTLPPIWSYPHTRRRFVSSASCVASSAAVAGARSPHQRSHLSIPPVRCSRQRARRSYVANRCRPSPCASWLHSRWRGVTRLMLSSIGSHQRARRLRAQTHAPHSNA